MHRFSWVKDSLIQIIFISFAVVFTVFIAQITISEQYTHYYESRLEAKTETMARGAALLFTENEYIRNAAGMSFVLDIIFPGEEHGAEAILYTLFTPGGNIAASTISGDLTLPDDALGGVYTYMASPFVRSFHPVVIDGAVRYILMVQIDDTHFLEFSVRLAAGLYESLIRGILMMAGGYALFSAISNLRKKKGPAGQDDTPQAKSTPNAKSSILPRIIVQLVSMFACILLASLMLLVFNAGDGALRTTVLFIGGLLAALAVGHFLRILLWFVMWYSKRPISSYAAQTMQFFVFLVMFLSIYVFTMQNGYSAQIELLRMGELRISSVFAGLSLSGGDAVDADLFAQAQAMDFGEYSEGLIIVREGDGFAVFGDPSADVSYASDLFFSAWAGHASVTGIRGGYEYGVTVIADSALEVVALAAVRQSATVQADAMRGANIDFLLAMSATVFAFVFLFIEINHLLESVNIPNMKRERGLRYAKSTRSLMFLASVCRYIPLFFFVIIVYDIYVYNPVAWLPAELATLAPIAVVVLVMAIGRDIAARVIRLRARAMMTLGCVIGATGFLVLPFASTLATLLGLLILAYTGVSMVYNGLWDYASSAASTGYGELRGMKEHTLSGEYLGGATGAVVGAMVFDHFGLLAAFALSGAILLILMAFIRALLPVGEKTQPIEKCEYGFARFFFSRRVLLFMLLLLLPFVLGEYFIEQFSPLYAESIALSPGAASWTSLLMTMALAYIGPGIVGLLTGRISKTVICVFANVIAAAGLALFALFPGIAGMYVAAALIGVSIGVGKNIIADSFALIDETKRYTHSGYVYNLFDSLFGLAGAALFTLVFILGAENLFAIVAFVVGAALLYQILQRRMRG